jgi:hypothetical protein
MIVLEINFATAPALTGGASAVEQAKNLQGWSVFSDGGWRCQR